MGMKMNPNLKIIVQGLLMIMTLYITITSLIVRFENPALSETEVLIETLRRLTPW